MSLIHVVIEGNPLVRRFVLFGMVMASLMVGAATATAGSGNSDSAKACQNGGWQNLVGANAAAFGSQGDCVSYVSHGGSLSPKTASQVRCESYGGSFSTDPASSHFDNPAASPIWSCNGADLTFANDAWLANDCFHDGGAYAWGTVAAPWYFTCY
jgi:hypothetical protein